jgi:phosphate-transporting ATPase
MMPCHFSGDWDYRLAAEPGRSEDFSPERSNGWGLRGGMLRSRVLLLDEPTSALDATSTAIVESIVRERISGGTGVIWSTHDSAQARRVGSRLFVMVGGGRIEEHQL